MTAVAAAQAMYCSSIKADFIFLDADHFYAGVLLELFMFYTNVKTTGYIMGDDFVRWPEVTEAVYDFIDYKNERLLDNFYRDKYTYVFQKTH